MHRKLWVKWFPWRYVIKRVARSYGFIDPISVLSRLHGFAQPAEVQQPMELLRAGVVFHARGLVNTQAIQHNMDWVWPYWVERQFNPRDESFLPRAFSITHINLTHRNWTAIGVPGFDEYPIVDPAGLLTPFWDGWSIDTWMIGDAESGNADYEVLPSRGSEPSGESEVLQRLNFERDPSVLTEVQRGKSKLASHVHIELRDDRPTLVLKVRAACEVPAVLVVSVRPYNPEGVSFIHSLSCSDDGREWQVNNSPGLQLAEKPDRILLSNYKRGDVHALLRSRSAAAEHSVACDVGMATGAAVYKLATEKLFEVGVTVPLAASGRSLSAARQSPPRTESWESALTEAAKLRVPEPHFEFLFRASLYTLVLLSPGEVFPGPYTYRRFWFRDAAFILKALLGCGLKVQVERALPEFLKRQTAGGYFLSQEGEWDSNGEALWILGEYYDAIGAAPDEAVLAAIERAGSWIDRKRTPADGSSPHAGLLPAGFSAEHFGPSDFYYWDDFWAIAGLQAIAPALARAGRNDLAERFRALAQEMAESVERSVSSLAVCRENSCIPASPYRRMDAGAIGTLAASYPLQLWPPEDGRILGTVEFLLQKSFLDRAFFQDMIHSGLNVYLTLHAAQVLLRAGDSRYFELVKRVADLASPTGQWPEAIHPRTGGGCMGDGHHAWASAEWVLMMRNMFVREEGNTLVLLSGIPERWLVDGAQLAYGPTFTRFGRFDLQVAVGEHSATVRWTAAWKRKPQRIEIHLPGRAALELQEREIGDGSQHLDVQL